MQELEEILEEIEQKIEKAEKIIVKPAHDKLDQVANETAEAFIEAYKECKDIIRKHMNDGWIPVEDERLWDILFEEACVEGEQAKRIYNRLKETFGGERSGKIDKISLQNAVETPFWMMVWATEPERLIDVRMSYSDLKIICDLIDSERNRRAGEQNE